jgi:hypothetical protein
MAGLSCLVMIRGELQDAAIDGNAYGVASQSVPSRDSPWETSLFSVESESAVVADGLFLARSAALMPSGIERTALLNQVIAMVTPLRARKAYWGEASTTLAYAYGLLDRDSARFAPMLRENYAQSPYLRSSANWRIDAGLAHWDALDTQTRRRLVDEAVWFARINPGSVNILLPRFRGTAAYESFMFERLKARIGDRDFSPIEALAKQQAGQ